MLDRGVKTVDDVKRVTDRPILGTIAHDPDTTKRPLIVEVDPRSPRAEAFRSMRTNLQFVDVANHPRTIVVTSSIAGEGKSTLTANLALTMSQAGARVCLVEADLRRPKVLDYMGLEGAVGLTDALIDQADVFDVIQPYGGTNLWVLGAGRIPPNPSELLGSTAMRTLLANLASRFDYVIVDAPPTLPVTDAVVLSKVTDGAIVVAGSGLVDREQLAHTLDSLTSVGGQVLGVVLNRVPERTLGGVRAVLLRHARRALDPPRPHPRGPGLLSPGRGSGAGRTGPQGRDDGPEGVVDLARPSARRPPAAARWGR